MIRRLVVRTHHRVLTTSRIKSRNAAAIIPPAAVAASAVSSAQSHSCARHDCCPRDAGSGAVSRRAFASSGTSDVIEADFIEKDDAPPTGTSDETEVDFVEKNDAPPTTEKEGAPPATISADWCGAAPDRATYGRIIDAARLIAEFAYDANEAVVGALAEASGDEGAAERWVRGVVGLLEGSVPSLLPTWWNEGHRDEVLRLAMRRNGGHFAKRGLDVERLKADLGRDAFEKLDDVALEVYACVIMMKEVKNEDNDMVRRTMLFSKEAIGQAIQVWGEETANQLFKTTKKEMEEEQTMGEELTRRLREQL